METRRFCGLMSLTMLFLAACAHTGSSNRQSISAPTVDQTRQRAGHVGTEAMNKIDVTPVKYGPSDLVNELIKPSKVPTLDTPSASNMKTDQGKLSLDSIDLEVTKKTDVVTAKYGSLDSENELIKSGKISSAETSEEREVEISEQAETSDSR